MLSGYFLVPTYADRVAVLSLGGYAAAFAVFVSGFAAWTRARASGAGVPRVLLLGALFLAFVGPYIAMAIAGLGGERDARDAGCCPLAHLRPVYGERKRSGMTLLASGEPAPDPERDAALFAGAVVRRGVGDHRARLARGRRSAGEELGDRPNGLSVRRWRRRSRRRRKSLMSATNCSAPSSCAELEMLKRRLEIHARSGELGERAAPRRGGSAEFQEHRPYAPGDDPRRIDWLAFARTGQPVTKLFRAEEDTVVRLVLDASASQGFGSPSKHETDATPGGRDWSRGPGFGAARRDRPRA